jgi:peptidoglycan/xylan/chitin deacetylase (PgdA/CDA1 family)
MFTKKRITESLPIEIDNFSRNSSNYVITNGGGASGGLTSENAILGNSLCAKVGLQTASIGVPVGGSISIRNLNIVQVPAEYSISAGVTTPLSANKFGILLKVPSDSIRPTNLSSNYGGMNGTVRMYEQTPPGGSRWNWDLSLTNFLRDGWSLLEFFTDKATASGGVLPTDLKIDLKSINISFSSQNTAIASTPYFVQGVYTNYRDRPTVCLTFDDGTSSHYTKAFPELTSRNLSATFYLHTDRLNTGGFMTTAQAQELHAAGHAIANHGADEPQLAFSYGSNSYSADGTRLSWRRSTSQHIKDLVNKAKDFLIANNMAGAEMHTCAPTGQIDDHVIVALDEIGAETCRTTDPGDTTTNRLLDYSFTYPVTRLNLRTIDAAYLNSEQAVLDSIMEAVYRGGMVSLMFHAIVDSGGTGITLNLDRFQRTLDYVKKLRDAGLIDVVTIPEWSRRAKFSASSASKQLYSPAPGINISI